MAYSNMIKELSVLGTYEPNKVWDNYCEYIEKSEDERNNPDINYDFSRYKGYGLSSVQNIYKNQGIALVFLHYGNYRQATITMLKTLYELDKNKKVLLVVDQESYDTENTLTKMMRIYTDLNVELIIAEKSSTGLRIAKHLKRGGAVILYLDGMTGYGKDKYPIKTPLISSNVNIRSGFFRILDKIKTPVFGIISQKEELLISPPIAPTGIKEVANSLVSFYRPVLLENPSEWRLWYRHHLYVERFPEVISDGTNSINNDAYICKDVEPNLVLDEETGNVYKYMETY